MWNKKNRVRKSCSFVGRLLGCGLLICFASLSSAAPSGREAFDVNDVSVLFPLKNKAPYPALNVDSDDLLPQAVFEAVLRFEDPAAAMGSLPYLDGKFVGNRKRWFVTSMRIDDCGDVFDFHNEVDGTRVASKKPGCQARLRLVIQPFNLFGNPIATAIHLLFSLDGQARANLVEDLGNIKKITLGTLSVETTGLPLMLHPGLVAESQTNDKEAVGTAIRSAVLKAVGGKFFAPES